jgi:uncharacterized protein YbaR (Trm112 family)
VSQLEYPIIWPSLSEELKPFLKYCKGLVLNAGSGQRDLKLGERELNIDIVPETRPNIIGDLHSIPLLDETVDTIVSIAVLEHTKFPWIVAQEFYRVLKPGGYGIIAVPFIQPQHACPGDYCRFTENGLVELAKYTGFEVIETDHIHHFGQTIAWLLWEYLQENMPQNKLILRFWLWLIRQLSLGNILGGNSSNTHNTHYIVVRKLGEATDEQIATTRSLIKDASEHWFFPLLSCPTTKLPLQLKGSQFVSSNDAFRYEIADKIPRLLPSGEIKDLHLTQDHERTKKSIAIQTLIEPEKIIELQVTEAEKNNQVHFEENTATELAPSRFFSTQEFEVSFRSPFAEQLQRVGLDKVALLATTEYEGIFKNGGIGTHYRTLSEQLAKNGWHVILLLCTQARSYEGTSDIAAVDNIFSIQEVQEVLALQPAHRLMLTQFGADWIEYQSFCCLLFTQALSKLFRDKLIYVEFHEMYGTGYHTIQAKQCNLLGDNCVIGVTMHSGCEWIYEANEWFAEEYPSFYKQLCDYEQFTFENADLTFFPSYYLEKTISKC